MSDKHTALLGKTDAELLVLAPEATHQHYKGGLYQFVGDGIHTETEEPLTGYWHVHPYDRRFYARPLEMFHGEHKDELPRFRKLGSEKKPFALVSEVKPGDYLTPDAGFSCLEEGLIYEVVEEKGALKIQCEAVNGHHLDGQISGEPGKEFYVGLYLAKKL